MKNDPIRYGICFLAWRLKEIVVFHILGAIVFGIGNGLTTIAASNDDELKSRYVVSSGNTSALQSMVQDHLKKLKTLAYPTTFSELCKWKLGKNVAVEPNELLVAIESVKDIGEASVEKLLRDQAMTQAQLIDCQILLKKNAAALESIHSIAHLARKFGFKMEEWGYYTTNGEYSSSRLLPSVGERAGKLLQIEAVWHAKCGDARSSLCAIEAMCELAEALDNQADMETALTGQVILLNVCLASEILVHRKQLRGGELEELQGYLESAENRSWIAHALIGERCREIYAFKEWRTQIIPFLETMNSLNEEGVSNTPNSLCRQFESQKDDDFLCCLGATEDLIASCKMPYQHIMQSGTNVMMRLHEGIKSQKRHVYLYSSHVVDGIVAGFLCSAIHTMKYLRVTELAVACQRYRYFHEGHWPDTVDVLKPEYMSSNGDSAWRGTRFALVQEGDLCIIYCDAEDEERKAIIELAKQRSEQRHERQVMFIFYPTEETLTK